ncbi:MAG: histidine kinase [Ferruginibacter sp.]
MFNRDFIFAETRKAQVKRHLVFWFCWWLFFGTLHAVQPFGKDEISYFRNLPFTLLESILLLAPQVILVYSLLIFILPHLILKEKYVAALFWTIIAVLVTCVINLMMIKNINRSILSFLLPEKFLVGTERKPAMSFAMGILASLKGGLNVVAYAVGIKFVKHWYVKEQRNLQLQKENKDAQLQLLTAQVHPHFLFNTLNNIYSRAQTESPATAGMIMELSHLMRYVLDEGKADLVPLEHELQMITDYINLEKMRYDDKLDLHIYFPEEVVGYYIAPLLLLPFIENCFKHGTSKMLDSPWVNLKLELENSMLNMKLMNGKKATITTNTNRLGIGIQNVKTRLELLYKNKYELKITEDDDVFVVSLSLELLKVNIVAPVIAPEKLTKYA